MTDTRKRSVHLPEFKAKVGLCVPGGHHRLVLEEGAQLAHQQQHGGGVLRGLLGGCLARARQT